MRRAGTALWGHDPRRGRGRGPGRVLPRAYAAIRPRRLSNYSFPCYCSFKVYSLSEPLFSFGQKYSRVFRMWFSIGVGFSLAALFGIALILLWEVSCAVHITGEMTVIDMLFGTTDAVSKWNFSLADAGFVFFSTLISVSVHELGHALAAASEGVKAEYFAIFIAVLFPGALVAFDNDLLQEMPNISALRIYCAGIWHNGVSCAAVGMMLLLLPWILSPIYIHGQNPMVLGVDNSSPLYGYLSPGDVIKYLDGIPIHDPQEWVDVSYMVGESLLNSLNYSNYDGGITIGYRAKGYCLPNALINESVVGNKSSCPPNTSRFVRTTCASGDALDGHIDDDAYSKSPELCLASHEIVGRKRCHGEGVESAVDVNGCLCSEDEACLAPFQTKTSSWIEITYSYAYALECGQTTDKWVGNFWFSEANISTCIRSFIYIGDVESLVDSIWLTRYQPRWAFIWTRFPYILERVLISIYHTSLLLVILNCLPVYLLDGEYILEAALCAVNFLSPRRRRRFLQGMLVAGTCISMLLALRTAHLTWI